jgi:hypothetical protein
VFIYIQIYKLNVPEGEAKKEKEAYKYLSKNA